MTTVQYNILGESATESAVNGTDVAPALRVRAPRTTHAQTAATAEDIKQHQEIRARLRARLGTLKEEEAQILTELGEETKKRGRRAQAVSGVDGETMSAPTRTPRSKASAKTRNTREPKALSKSSEKEDTDSKAILAYLKSTGEHHKVASIAEAVGLDRKEAARHLGNLREQKKVTSRGQARGTEYAAR